MGKANILEVIEAFLLAKKKYHQLSIDEFTSRIWNEDIIADVNNGKFKPYSSLNGWLVKEEHGPLSEEEVIKILKSGKLKGEVFVKLPNSKKWEKVTNK